MSSPTGETASVNLPVRDWRSVVLDQVLTWAGVAAGGMAVLSGPALFLQGKLFEPASLGLGVLLLLLVAFAVQPRLGYRIRALGLVIVAHGLTIASVLGFGFQPGILMTAFITLFLSALFFDRVGAAVSMVAITPVLALVSAQTLSDCPWYMAAASFVMTAIAATALFLRVLQTLTSALDEKIAAVSELEREQTERLATEAALEEARRALEDGQRFEAIGRLAGGVAHEFNNLLQVILSWSDVIETEAEDPDLQDASKMIRRSAEDAAEVTQALSTIASRGDAETSSVRLHRRLERWVNAFRPLLPERVQVEVRTSEVPSIRVNETSLRQAVLNLIKNAADACPGRGTIVVSVRYEERCDRRPVHLTVEDDGPGMDEPTRRRAFEPFFTTKGSGGTGLGMSIVRGTVEQFGGRVGIESEPGQGTRVTVRLPAAAEGGDDDTPFSGTPVPDSQPLHGRILLAEDEERVRAPLLRALRATGLLVVEAKDGDEAYAALEADGRFDVLCCDGVMPGRPSFEVIVKYRELNPAGTVIVCSGHLKDEVLLDVVSLNGVDLLPKPFRPAELLEKVADALHQHVRAKPELSTQ